MKYLIIKQETLHFILKIPQRAKNINLNYPTQLPYHIIH